jgi:hypothetical protein
VIKIRTAKSKGRTPQEITINAALQSLLDATPRRATTILTAGSGKPYTPNAITHALTDRLATIRNATRILVFEQGRVVEMGNFEELVARGGRFAALARAQYLAGAEERPQGGLAAPEASSPAAKLGGGG